MAIKISSNGEWVAEYVGPYAGTNVQAPETNIPDTASPDFRNFILRNSELRSRPQLKVLYNGVGFWQLGVTTFSDINGTYHTVIWSGSTMWQLNLANLPFPPWDSLGTCSPGNMQTNPLSYREFANKIYYSSIGFIQGNSSTGKPPTTAPFVGYWDGLSASPVYTQTFGDASTSNSIAGISKTDSPAYGGSLPGSPVMVGPLSIGGGYLGELNNQLILANVQIKDEGTGTIYPFPNLIVWCANGQPLQWDPTANVSAGFNPFLDVPDQITGLVTMGVAGYVFRTDGITQFAPSGSSINPWEFDHMWASEHGIGNVFPWSIAQYGPTAAFISLDNIYALSITNAEPIGGTARDAIFNDLAAASGTPFANIVPFFTANYVYLCYMLMIPLNGLVRMWLYSFEDKNWSPHDLAMQANPPYPPIVCAPNVV